MAGRGSRLRPHTLTVPKPLIPVAGKPIVRRIVEDLSAALDEKVDEVAFVIGDFGPEAERQLHKVAESIGARCSIYYQDEPLGPGHAVLCAKPSLDGHCLVAFADTLFKANFTFNPAEDGIIWVQKVEDPSSFGVVKVNDDNTITDFVEKSPTFVSDLAIVGIYYFNDGARLRNTL
ncbi:MAG: nucleotidyltransferase family protein, partial [Phaeodactylibacter sp.]|nr:nucleotidyltransferase family protein [Phaeodactylibacter sp.]